MTSVRSQHAELIDLPHLTAVNIQGGQPAAGATAGVDALEVAQVEDVARSLRSVADDGDLSNMVLERIMARVSVAPRN